MPGAVPRICDACGAAGQTSGFCEECGEAILANSTETDPGSKVPEAAAAKGPPAVDGDRINHGDSSDTWDLPRSAQPSFSPSGGQATLHSSGNWQQPPPAERPETRVDWQPSPAPAPDPAPQSQAPSPAARDERARALLVPVEDPSSQAGPATAAPVLPGRPEAARPSAVRMHENDTGTGGAPCPFCSALNPVGLHFCRRCAMSLADKPGEAPVRLSWWRRVFHWRPREVLYAGQRPRLARNPGRLTRWIVALAVVIVLAVVGGVWGPDAVNAVEDHFAHPSITFASSVTASHSDANHPASMLHDSYNNTWWGTGVTGPGTGTYVTATFNQPIDLLDIVITPGAGVQQNAFISQGRPEQVKVTLNSAGGASTSSTITLSDSPGAQTFSIHGRDVNSVRFTIESSYTPPGTDKECAISELEFFSKS